MDTIWCFRGVYIHLPGLPRWLSGKESSWQCRRHRKCISLGQEDPLEEKMATNPLKYSCLDNSMDRGGWWTHKSWTRLGIHTYTNIPLGLSPPQCHRCIPSSLKFFYVPPYYFNYLCMYFHVFVVRTQVLPSFKFTIQDY